MNQTDAHKPGYKYTPLGWIPDDWDIEKVGELCDFIVPGRNKPTLFDGDIPWITTPDIENHEIVYSSKIDLKLSKEEAKKVGSKIVPKNSIIMSCVGELGIVAITGNEVVINQQLHAFIPKGRIDVRFLLYALSFQNKYIESVATKTAVPYLNKTNCNSIPIPFPKICEQIRIGKILSMWDEAIQKTQQLIERLKLRNKGLMQDLLTGKKRLRGFNDNWKNVMLGDVTAKISRRNGELVNAKVYSVTNTNGFVLQSDHFEREIAGADLSNYKIIRKNEFAYNPARINVGSIAYFSEPVGIISSLYVCFKTKNNLLDVYLWYLFDLDLTKHRIISLGEGGVRIYLWYDLFAKIKIALPTMEEQVAIMKILTEADNELKLNEQKLAALQQQKKGLMQRLLSGGVRVKV